MVEVNKVFSGKLDTVMKMGILLMVLISVFAQAQYFDKYYGFGTALNVPLSNRSYINNLSVRGGKFYYRELLNEKFAMGIDLSFASYNDYIPPKVYTTPTSALFTDFYNYLNNYGLTLSGEYLFNTESRFMPYAGMGVGASYLKFTLYYNIFNDAEAKWGMLFRPYAGLMMRFGTKNSWGAFANTSIDYSTVKADNYGYKGFASLGLQIGLVYLNW